MFTRRNNRSCEFFRDPFEVARNRWFGNLSDVRLRKDELGEEIETVKLELRDMSSAVKTLKERLAKLERDSFQATMNAFKTQYESWQRMSLIHSQPLQLLNSWRGVVNEKPDFKWSVENFSYFQNYVFNGYSTSSHCSCVASMEEPGSYHLPRFSLKLDFAPDDEEPMKKPAVFVVVKGRNAAGLLKRVVERQDATGLEDYGRSFVQEPTSHHCVSLDIELYVEQPWSVQQVQSKDGVLMWTVKKFQRLFAEEHFVLYSPYFRTRPSGGLLVQAVLQKSTAGFMTLLVIRRSELRANDFSHYVIKVTVYRPNFQPNERSFAAVSDLREKEECDVGSMENILDNDTFLCRVKILSGC